MIEFFMPMIPPTTTHQMKRMGVNKKGKAYVYEDDNLKLAREKLSAHIGKYRPQVPYNSAVRLMVKWCFPITGKHCDGEYKATKPDTDNLQKLLKDVMTANKFWQDDALVSCEIVEKFYAENVGIYVCVEEV